MEIATKSSMKIFVFLWLGSITLSVNCFAFSKGSLPDRYRQDAAYYFSSRNVRRLAEAAAKGDTHVVDVLIKGGVDINTIGVDGVTPLWWAIRNDNVAGFKRLLEIGAKIDMPDSEEYWSVMQLAAGHSEPEFLRLLIAAKADVNRVYKKSRAPVLLTAATWCRKKNVEMLIAAGANLDWVGTEATAAEIAATMGQYEIVYMLLKAGAKAEKLPGQKYSLAEKIKICHINPNLDVFIWRERVMELMAQQGVVVSKPEGEGSRTLPMLLQGK